MNMFIFDIQLYVHHVSGGWVGGLVWGQGLTVF